MIRTTCAVLGILALVCIFNFWRSNVNLQPMDGQQLVPEISTEEVLKLIREGKRVVFVDARERQEWQEEHIPGAINMSLREVGQLDDRTLGDPDLVIAYCLKDFRGFEVAKSLRGNHVKRASILAEYGINGWKKKGLPTVIAGRTAEPDGIALLNECARGGAHCVRKAL